MQTITHALRMVSIGLLWAFLTACNSGGTPLPVSIPTQIALPTDTPVIPTATFIEPTPTPNPFGDSVDMVIMADRTNVALSPDGAFLGVVKNGLVYEANEAGVVNLEGTWLIWDQLQQKTVEAFTIDKGNLKLWSVDAGRYKSIFLANSYVADSTTGWVTGLDSSGALTKVYDSLSGDSYVPSQNQVIINNQKYEWDGASWRIVIAPTVQKEYVQVGPIKVDLTSLGEAYTLKEDNLDTWLMRADTPVLKFTPEGVMINLPYIKSTDVVYDPVGTGDWQLLLKEGEIQLTEIIFGGKANQYLEIKTSEHRFLFNNENQLHLVIPEKLSYQGLNIPFYGFLIEEDSQSGGVIGFNPAFWTLYRYQHENDAKILTAEERLAYSILNRLYSAWKQQDNWKKVAAWDENGQPPAFEEWLNLLKEEQRLEQKEDASSVQNLTDVIAYGVDNRITDGFEENELRLNILNGIRLGAVFNGFHMEMVDEQGKKLYGVLSYRGEQTKAITYPDKFGFAVGNRGEIITVMDVAKLYKSRNKNPILYMLYPLFHFGGAGNLPARSGLELAADDVFPEIEKRQDYYEYLYDEGENLSNILWYLIWDNNIPQLLLASGKDIKHIK